MTQSTNVAKLSEVLDSVRERLNSSEKAPVYRFEIFKGKRDSSGKVVKVKAVGAAYLREGLKTYTVHLKTFLQDKFYLLPNSKPDTKAEFVILTREPAQFLGKKYFWNNVGAGHLLDGINHGVLQLDWDVLAGDLYMNLHAVNVSETPEATHADVSAA